jgi:hypothetical protein
MGPDPSLTERQQQLYAWLQDQSSLSVVEILDRYQISVPTAYRDMRALVNSGRAVKSNQGIRLAPAPVLKPGDAVCTFCGGEVNTRVAFIIVNQDGLRQTACCPHCGLMALDQPGVQLALACDFLHGRMVNARQASFLVNSQALICCEPSVLCFADAGEALRFQAGFGGEIYPLEQARRRVNELMAFQKND